MFPIQGQCFSIPDPLGATDIEIGGTVYCILCAGRRRWGDGMICSCARLAVAQKYPPKQHLAKNIAPRGESLVVFGRVFAAVLCVLLDETPPNGFSRCGFGRPMIGHRDHNKKSSNDGKSAVFQMTQSPRFARKAIIVAALLALAGCNTIAGVGEDVTGTARSVQSWF